MIAAISVCAVTCAAMILSVLFFPQLRLGKLRLSTYWLVVLAGAAVLLIFRIADAFAVWEALVSDTAVNPLKILALFLSMTMLSVFLDELGFFRYLASAVLRHAGSSCKKLFFLLYAVVSVLTVFTSNDIIILSFTPFICYFSRSAKIDPVPFLVTEFVAANTWSMALIIGNPTNIYLASSFGIGFVEYLRYSLLPTACAGLVSLPVLYLLFRKKLTVPAEGEAEQVEVADRLQLGVGIAHLAVCTVFLAVGPYFGAEMWLVSVCAAGSLFLFSLIFSAARRKKPTALLGSLKRAPWQLVPFVLSMFVMVVALSQHGVTEALSDFLGNGLPVLKYGVSSFLVSNLVNNIPMSVLFSSVLAHAPALPAAMATVIGSNLGALLTPIGALAGLMFGAITERYGVKLTFLRFMGYGAAVSIPALAAALGALALVV